MSDLSTELNLALAVDDDDLADYLDKPAGLRGSLITIDGLFNSSTGHNHNGAHQGGAIAYQDVSMAGNLSVTGTSDLHGTVHAYGVMNVDGAVTDASLHVTGATTLDGTITTTQIDGLFAGTVANPSTSYVVVTKIMYVFAQAALTVTLPAAATTNRPIEVWALNGQVNVNASGGTVYGGSINLATGAVQNGIILTGDAITYKSDLTNWRAA